MAERLTRKQKRELERNQKKGRQNSPTIAPDLLTGPEGVLAEPTQPTIDLSVIGSALREPTTLGMALTSRSGVETRFQEAGFQLPIDRIVNAQRGLEIVNKTATRPIVVNSSLSRIISECGLDRLGIPVRLYFIDQPLPAARAGTFQEDIGQTFFQRNPPYIVSIVSMKGVADLVAQDRLAVGDFSLQDTSRIHASFMYRLSEITGHELFHAGRHIPLGETTVLNRFDELEGEAREYSHELARRVTNKEIPPLPRMI